MDGVRRAHCSSPKKRKHKNFSAEISEPRVVRTPNQTYSYGETPVAICRRHFEEMATHFNVPVEEFAENVLKGSLADQLLKLAEFYKSKDKDTEAVFNPLVEQAMKHDSSEQTNASTSTNKVNPNKTTPVKRMQIVISQTRKARPGKSVLRKSNDPPISNTHLEGRLSRQAIEESSSKQGSSPVQSPEAINATAVIANDQPISVNQTLVSTNPDDLSLALPNDTTRKAGMIISPVVPNKNPVNPTECKETLIASPSASERKETTEELEAFLFGDLPYVAKTPPRKKRRKSSEFTSPSEPGSTRGGSPCLTSPCLVKPALTFDTAKWSPSRQRDLLSIAKDIAKLQRSLESGDLPQEPVSKLVSFTKPSD